MASRPTEEELLRVLDDFEDANPQQVRRTGKRSSILKQPKNFEDICLTEDFSKRKSYSKRRVSFADKFQVMELCTGNIYDVPGKSVSSSDSAINPDISCEAKSEAALEENGEQISGIKLQVSSSSNYFEMRGEKYSMTNTTRKHKMDSVDDTEPQRKKVNALEKSFIGNTTSVENMVAEFQNYMLKFSQNDQDTNRCQDMEFTFVQSVDTNVDVMQSLILNKTDDRISANKFQEVLSIPQSQKHEKTNFSSKNFEYDNVFSAADNKIKTNFSEQCLYDTFSKQVPNVQLFPVSPSCVPLEENKENIYIDAKNKKVLVTSGRHLKLKEKTSVNDAQIPKPSLDMEASNLKDINATVPIKNIRYLMSFDSPSEVHIVKQKENSKFDKTYLFNQSMDLTCILPELNKFHDTEPSIQNDFLKNVNTLPLEKKVISTDENLNTSSLNTFPDSKFKRPNSNLNKTKLNICDMDLTTCYAGIRSVDDSSIEDDSFVKYNPTTGIFCSDIRRPVRSPMLQEITSKKSLSNYILTKSECEPVSYSISSLVPKKLDTILNEKETDILYDKSENSAQAQILKQEEKSAFDKTALFNQSMDLLGISSSDTRQPDPGFMLPENVLNGNLSCDLRTELKCRPIFDSYCTKHLVSKKTDYLTTGKENFVSSSDILCDKSQNSTPVQVLKQVEKSVYDKTVLLNQSMDLTCSDHDFSKLNDSRCNVQEDFPSVKNSASETKHETSCQETNNEPLNVIPACRFTQPSVNLNKTKLNSYDMELTFGVGSHSSQNLSFEDASSAKHESASELSPSDTKHQPISNHALSETVSSDRLLSASHKDMSNKSLYMPMSDSFPTENSAQEAHSINSLEGENLNCVAFNDKFQNSCIKKKLSPPSTLLSLSTMELTCYGEQSCNDSSIEEVNIRSSQVANLKEDISFLKVTRNDENILTHDKNTNDFEQHNKSQLCEMQMELTCRDKLLQNDSPNSSKISFYGDKTNITFDTMELTCLVKNDSELTENFVDENHKSTKIYKAPSKRKSDEFLVDEDCDSHKIPPLDCQKEDFVSTKENVGMIFKKRNIQEENEFQNSTLLFKKGVCASSTKIFDNASKDFISNLQTEDSLEDEKEIVSNNANSDVKLHSFILSQTAPRQRNTPDIIPVQLLNNSLNENTAVNEIRLPNNSMVEVLSDKFLKSEVSCTSNSKFSTTSVDKETQHLASDFMELTCRSKWSKPQIPDQTSKNLNLAQVGEKTQHFCSELMELTCNAKNVSDTNPRINDTATLISVDKDNKKPIDYAENFDPYGISKSKIAGKKISVSHLQINDAVPEMKTIKPALLETPSVSCNIECSNCSDIVQKQKTVSKEWKETNAPLSLKSNHASNEENCGKLEKSKVIENASSESKRMYEYAKSGIVYAIKKLKAMNHLSDTDSDILKFPEVFLSLKKQPKSLTSFSCTKIKLSDAVRNAVRQSYSFNCDGKELSFIAEMNVRQSPTTGNYQRLRKNEETDSISEDSVTDASAVFIPGCSENIECFVKNDADASSHTKYKLHDSFAEENIELISDSILNDISITRNDTNSVSYKNLTSDNCLKESNSSIQPVKISQKKSSKNQENYKLKTPTKLEISCRKMASPEDVHKTIVLSEEKLYDDCTLDDVFLKELTNQIQDINKDACEMRTPVLDPPTHPGQPEIVDYDRNFVTIKWKKPDNDSGHPIIGYLVEKKDKYCPDWVPVQRVPGDEEATTIPDLVEENEYKFRVCAVNSVGTSEPSKPTAPHAAQCKKYPPTHPGLPTVVAYDKNFATIKWKKPDNDGGHPITEYVVEKIDKYCPDWVPIQRVVGSEETATIPDLVERNEYKFRVCAVNCVGMSEPSESTAVHTARCKISPPATPEVIQLNNVTKDGCTVVWTPSKNDNESEIIHYVIEMKDVETGKWMMLGESVNPQIKVDKLIEGHEYSFRVKAVNKGGESLWLFGKHSIVAKNPFVAPDINKSLLNGSNVNVNVVNNISLKDDLTPTAHIASDPTEKSDSEKYIPARPTTFEEDPAVTVIDDSQLTSSSDVSDEVLKKITLWRRKFIEASQEEDCLWSFEEMDGEKAVFEINGYSLFGAYFMHVPLQLNSQCSSGTEITFHHIHDADEITELGFFLLMDHLSGHTKISPFSPEALLAKFPIILDAALKAKSLMKDVALVSVRSELSVDYSQALPRLKVRMLKKEPFSIFSLTFPINVKTYPHEKIVPEVEHLKYDEIEKKTILDALMKIEPGTNYLRRMQDAVHAL